MRLGGGEKGKSIRITQENSGFLGNGAVALEIINALDESFLQMVMSFVKAELERALRCRTTITTAADG